MDKMIGIITANYDTPDLKELTNERTAASLPYAGRYRLIDFALSNMSNSGISSVGVITPYKYRSLLDHIGSGSEWNLDRKSGGLFILPGSVFGIKSPGSRFLLRDINRNMVFLSRAATKYVVISTASAVMNIDYADVLREHEKSGADITMVCMTAREDDKDLMSVELEGDRVKSVSLGVKSGERAFIDSFIISYDLLLKILEWYSAIDYLDFFEVIAADLDKMDVRTYEFEGYVGSVFTADAYYKRSMDLLDMRVSEELFTGERPIMTKITDATPSKYTIDADVSNSLIPAGCFIAGSVKDSVLFRGVDVKRGAVVKNSIILQSCTIEPGCVIENAIIDRSNYLSAGTVIKGSEDAIFIMAKNELGK